jgi:hypothetical protein
VDKSLSRAHANMRLSISCGYNGECGNTGVDTMKAHPRGGVHQMLHSPSQCGFASTRRS